MRARCRKGNSMSNIGTELKEMHDKFVADVKTVIRHNCPYLSEVSVAYMTLMIYQRYVEDQKSAIRLVVNDIEESLKKEFGTDETKDKGLYEGDDVIVKEPWDIKTIEGYSAAFCKCGHVLHIKTPKIKTWHQIKCPKCGFVINLFCGEEGELLTMNHIRDMYDAK